MPATNYKRYSLEVRVCALRVAKEAKDWKAVAELHKINERTAWGWIKTAMDTGDWIGEHKQRGGSSKKLVDAHVDYLLGELATTPELTLVQMAELVEQRFGVSANRETVRRALDGRSFTLKKLHRDVVNRNSPINKQKRYDYVVDFYAAIANNKKVFYLDETNFNLWCSRGRGWSRRGQRAVQTSVASKGKNIHVIAVISSTGVAYQESQFGSFTADLANESLGGFCATSKHPHR
ncbi:hypothetical protein PC129_g6866 [Phytophthora cactorum]|uniref:Uncharacterized protein n=3 Tax=Phytophthora cactorum TaxID=29920 RepID=A0A8T1C0Z5_9STRA|nr:hypothetical protein Pcac1_g608 [Phytophthora cactorum]KAG2817991.1 hypothetical protein PC112_g12812 [Phytophthora cactorum]KAG2831778.1 hypothetical protein PC111_g6868 [Phytophthora cactorum]KAG2855930.1 hypothetical protein PC113_g12021 [Phytophthora cactorum]KAG2912701.1 hypothetical protein PC115_g12259 [Phytophthora cactorum]